PTCLGEPATIVGTRGNDVLRASSDDVVVGLGGNDVIYAHRLSDELCGSGGNDWIRGTHSGGEQIAGGSGSDTIYGLGQMDSLHGGRGDDLLIGDPRGDVPRLYARDELYGGRGDDRMYGFGHADLLYGGAGNDILGGGRHYDVLRPGPGDDFIRAGGGRDVVLYGDSLQPVSVDLTLGRATGEGTDSFEGVEGVSGSRFDDDLVGSAGPDMLIGDAGADSLAGLDGEDVMLPDLTAHASGGVGYVDDVSDDVVDGGGGTDSITFYRWPPAPLTIDLLAGRATGEGSDTLVSIEDVFAIAFADVWVRGTDDANLIATFSGGDDYVEALGGDDRVLTGGGMDEVDGGDGIDECVSAEIARNCESEGPVSKVRLTPELPEQWRALLRYFSIGTPTRLPYSVHEPS
ncbi:MAG: hypothetical protein M3271_08640, partial [Actinomycetota bacterium]|nr:hypothetical protein [Actinomycetota bacterium]